MVDSYDNPMYRNKPSTRVHAAPGGASSICFGDDVPSPSPAVRSPGVSTASSPAPPSASPSPRPPAGNHGVSQDCSASKTSVRVHQPPGGRSSIHFG
ncbi:hypothetical protein BESB_003690 [Besnoitia besnoiti]|uniref:Uncharacterized protein n=1 Tax=Besnoitia besnoiti TaxID=94643 RepID=A0A2A9MHL3_BESBE|nr:hypothetical protein BESB_003690 [Besnoitia besnoiti]PFH38028.1 hypothetical protein BESB_003690 [Besnoitia besnoiti]